MNNYFKYALKIVVFICFSVSHAGSYDDFFVAIKRDNVWTMSDLLQRGFDPNTPSPQGVHGLILAIQEPSFRVIDLLIAWPSTRVEARNSADESPLMLAALKGYLEVCQKLLTRDADVNKTGWTPLHYAATGGHVEVVRLLLEHHAYLDTESPNGSTPLMMAAMYGNLQTVKVLLDAGADPGLANKSNASALDFAIKANKTDSAALIEAALKAKNAR
jgi:ankyrin repeat protein